MSEPRDIVVVPYPFTGQPRTKLRPILVIASTGDYGDFIGLAITSRPQHADAVALNQSEMETGQLPRPSWIRTDKVFTLNESLLVKTVGKVKQERLKKALADLCGLMGCT